MVDISHPQYEDQIKAVNRTLQELGVTEKPTLMVFNKIDRYRQLYFDAYLETSTQQEIERELQGNLKNDYEHDNIFLSALQRENLAELRGLMTQMIRQQYAIRYPYQAKTW